MQENGQKPAPGQRIRSYPLRHSANEGKLAQVRALLAPWRQALTAMSRRLYRMMLDGQPLDKFMQTKASDLSFTTPLLARHVKSVYNQTFAAVKSWQNTLQVAVRETIRGSSLDGETKELLYRANAYRAWFCKELVLPRSVNTKTGEIRYGQIKGKTWAPAAGVSVPAELLRLLRHMARHWIKRRVRFPNLSRVNSMDLNGTIAQIEKPGKDGAHDFWVRITTLNSGKPVRIPLSAHKYFTKAPGELSGFVQVTVKRDNTVQFTLQKKSEPAKRREDNGNWLGLDFGMTVLFATSDGRLFGQGAMPHLRELDRQVTELGKALQRQGIPRKTNKRYQKFQQRIREYIKNEVNRILNRIATEDIAGLVVENLDFRGGGMSKKLNRLITRFGRKAIKDKLRSLTEDKGLAVDEVNAAYSSQECSGCGFVHRKNRSTSTRTKFLCRFCGRKSHADVNGSRTLVPRRSWYAQGSSKTRSQRMTVRERLDGEFQARWGLPPSSVDATGRGKVHARRRSAVRLATASPRRG
jgi:putative transposase